MRNGQLGKLSVCFCFFSTMQRFLPQGKNDSHSIVKFGLHALKSCLNIYIFINVWSYWGPWDQRALTQCFGMSISPLSDQVCLVCWISSFLHFLAQLKAQEKKPRNTGSVVAHYTDILYILYLHKADFIMAIVLIRWAIWPIGLLFSKTKGKISFFAFSG